VRCRRLLLAVLAVVVVAGCQVRTEVTVTVDDDGSGEVEVAVGLDPEALARVPDLDRDGAPSADDLVALVRVDDLTAAGWTLGEISEPDEDGFVWLAATKPFGTPEEAREVLAELTGPDGGLEDLEVTRSSSFGVARYGFSGEADLSDGLEAFGDEGLATALDGEPLGQDAAAIEQRLGAPLAEMVTLTFRVGLPGGVDDRWEPVLGGESVEMKADSTVYDRPALALAVIAVGCLVALAVVLLRRRSAASPSPR
jgi:hypothetical protein